MSDAHAKELVAWIRGQTNAELKEGAFAMLGRLVGAALHKDPQPLHLAVDQALRTPSFFAPFRAGSARCLAAFNSGRVNAATEKRRELVDSLPLPAIQGSPEAGSQIRGSSASRRHPQVLAPPGLQP